MKKTLFSLISLALICACFVAFWGSKDLRGPLITPKIIWIPAGSGTADIADRLYHEGAISSPSLFLAHAITHLPRASLKAGEYDLPVGASIALILDRLRSGKVYTRKITIPEGLTCAQIGDLLLDNPYLSGPLTVPLPPEGSLLPETYSFVRGTPRTALLTRMQGDMTHLVTALWGTRSADFPLKTISEWVTLASIVEKETGKADERPHVAAVFLGRLKIGMRLQSDPTVIYAITQGKGPLGRPLTHADLSISSPYNTYQINGLPVGPIANPGRDSLMAVLTPLASDDLYFVADGTGGHAFARTLADHNKNVIHWRAATR